MLDIADWFEKGKKTYPWRINRTPYSVWVSEVMLQQTRAEVVIDYFHRFMQRYTSVAELSLASSEEVIKAFEGLGYYSRARNLHAGAKEVMEKFGGELPGDIEKLLSIKGIGPYTAGAIYAFGFGKRAPFIDGNIARVLSRYFAFEECVVKKRVKLTQMLDEVLPQERGPSVMEGLIELGQTVCKKRPDCQRCPLQKGCKAFAMDQVEDFPVKTKKKEITELIRGALCIRCNGHFLLKKNGEGQIMADLWEFPYFECVTEPCVEDFQEIFPEPLELVLILPKIVQHFTRYRVELFPYLFEASEMFVYEGYSWVAEGEMDKLPFSSAHKKIFACSKESPFVW